MLSPPRHDERKTVDHVRLMDGSVEGELNQGLVEPAY